MLQATSHTQKGAQAPGVAETQCGEVYGHRPAVTVDDLPEVPDGQAGGGDIQLAADVHDGLASWPDPVTQVERTGSVLLQSAASQASPCGG
jgi:hypothetical protein